MRYLADCDENCGLFWLWEDKEIGGLNFSALDGLAPSIFEETSNRRFIRELRNAGNHFDLDRLSLSADLNSHLCVEIDDQCDLLLAIS
jgi:hypothetical protein